MSETPHGLQNPINKLPMIHTPKDWSEIQDRIESFITEDKASATVLAGMVWNLAHEQVEDLIETEITLFKKFNSNK